MMIVADPTRTTANAEAIAKLLADRLHLDYFDLLGKLTKKSDNPGTKFREDLVRFVYIARRIPSTLASSVMDELKAHDFVGVDTRPDPLRTYPAGDVGANLIGYLGDDPTKVSGGLERSFNNLLAGKDGKETYEVGGGNRIPLGDNSQVKPVNGKDLKLTIDRDVQWYSQRVLRTAVESAKAESGAAVVLDSQTGEILALADYPTFDANKPGKADEEDLGSRALSDVYEPGSVEKVLTISSLLDAGKVTPRTRFTVPESLPVLDRIIGDWFDHGTIRLTMAGVLARSSNIGTALAATQFEPEQLWRYLDMFGLGHRTDIGMPGETRGMLGNGADWSTLTRAQVAFGQGLSVNALQMATAVNTIANGGQLITPSLVSGRATTASGPRVGTETSKPRTVVSARGRGRQTAQMMELVTTQDVGTAPRRRHRGLPRRRQDRHRPGGRRRLQVLRRRRSRGLVRRLRPGRQAALHRLRDDHAPGGGRQRWWHRRTGVPQDPELRAPEVRRAADGHHAVEDPHEVGPPCTDETDG